MTSVKKEEFIDPDSVDFSATQEKMRLVNVSRLAEDYGTSRQYLWQLLKCRTPAKRGPIYQRMLHNLQHDGWLVMKSETQKAA